MFGLYDMDDIYHAIICHDFQFWTTENSALITQVQYYPKKLVLHLFLAAGNLDELEELYLEAEAYARKEGCSYITILGRQGWEKSFLTKNHNFKVICSELMKEV